MLVLLLFLLREEQPHHAGPKGQSQEKRNLGPRSVNRDISRISRISGWQSGYSPWTVSTLGQPSNSFATSVRDFVIRGLREGETQPDCGPKPGRSPTGRDAGAAIGSRGARKLPVRQCVLLRPTSSQHVSRAACCVSTSTARGRCAKPEVRPAARPHTPSCMACTYPSASRAPSSCIFASALARSAASSTRSYDARNSAASSPA